jgi:sterol desaturase/sphingolipid hydroxylase (fatty acid hydroxylase superfamily)
MPALAAALLMSLIVGLRYLMVSGMFAALTRSTGRARAIPAGQVRAEIKWSLLSSLIYGVPAGVTYWAWNRHGLTQLYIDPRAQPLWLLAASPILYLFVHDTWFYWTHRLMHRPWWFRVAHAVHHRSRPPTAWAAMSFHPWEALSGALLFPALAWVVPIHVGMLGLVLLVASLFGTTNHMGWEMLPARIVRGPVGAALISAAHHELHHRNYCANYGLYFRFWDRVCGTDRGIAEDMLRGRRTQSFAQSSSRA